jgi:hypothetical protein
MLWRDDVVGWVNVSNIQADFGVDAGYAKAEPDTAAFRSAFDAEAERFRAFLAKR